MSQSYTNTESQTFTITHAKHIAAKVATDLKRMQRFYGYPSDHNIELYEAEIIAYLKNGYLDTVTYGFQRQGNWIEPTLRYMARDLSGMTSADDDPGRIQPNANIVGANFHSYLTCNSTWALLSQTEKDSFTNTLPIQRTGAPAAGINGYISNDKTYSSGGKGLDRSTIKS